MVGGSREERSSHTVMSQVYHLYFPSYLDIHRNILGIDCAYLAMDTEEGVEVVWNEATFSEAKKFKAQEDKLRSVFEILTLIDHPNIVKFHKYWTDEGERDIRVVRNN